MSTKYVNRKFSIFVKKKLIIQRSPKTLKAYLNFFIQIFTFLHQTVFGSIE